jgi:predicted phage terminase large subunit-like protein
MCRGKNGIYYVEDVVRLRGTPDKVRRAIKNTSTQDGAKVRIGIEQDPGQAGKVEVNDLIRYLAGFNVKAYPVQKDKVTRASPVSAQAEAGNVKLVRGDWNRDYLNELMNFPEGAHDDQVDGTSGGFQMLLKSEVNLTWV